MKTSARIEKAAEDIAFGPSLILINNVFGPNVLDTPLGIFVNLCGLLVSTPITLPLLAIAGYLEKNGY